MTSVVACGYGLWFRCQALPALHFTPHPQEGVRDHLKRLAAAADSEGKGSSGKGSDSKGEHALYQQLFLGWEQRLWRVLATAMGGASACMLELVGGVWTAMYIDGGLTSSFLVIPPPPNKSGPRDGRDARSGGREGPVQLQGHQHEHGGGPPLHAADGGGLPPHVSG